MFTCFKVVFYFVKNPRITNRSAPNHHAIETEFIFVFQCFFRRIDVAVSENRQGGSPIAPPPLKSEPTPGVQKPAIRGGPHLPHF